MQDKASEIELHHYTFLINPENVKLVNVFHELYIYGCLSKF